MKGWIGLERLKIYAYHGVYDFEREKGNTFTIDIKVLTDITEAASDDELSSTVNYEEVYRICKEQMEKQAQLLEHVAFRIVTAIKEEISQVESVDIRILKEEPPIGGDCKGSFVHFIS